MRKKDSIAIAAFIICILLMLLASTIVLYLEENKKYRLRKRTGFYLTVDVTSLGTIERMEYVICGEKTPIEPYEDEDGSIIWGEKISTPKQLLTSKGPPCPVEILITKEGETKRYPADQSFDCPDCDGSHYYKIIGDKAVYRYSP